MKSAYKISILTFFLVIISVTCQKPSYKTIEDILPVHQWRRTLEAVYNENGDFETYTFNFETAEDCEKNSFLYIGKTYSSFQNLCNNTWIDYRSDITNDSIYFIPYDFDTVHIGFSRFIESYDERNFVLRYNTLIESKKKIIKETFTAFD